MHANSAALLTFQDIDKKGVVLFGLMFALVCLGQADQEEKESL
jgi:hypothetical protein